MTTFIRYYNDEFDEAQIVLKRVNVTEPDQDVLIFCTESQKEGEIFREFHREHSMPISAESLCQCVPRDDKNQCISTKEILCDTF